MLLMNQQQANKTKTKSITNK